MNSAFNAPSKKSLLVAYSSSRGYYKGSNDQTPKAAPSSGALSVAASKPRDKHGMPVYRFSEKNRVVRTTAYTYTEADHVCYSNMNAAGTTLRHTKNIRSAAADWSYYPVGTTFKIKGMDCLFVVDDFGSALEGGGTIDIFKPTRGLMNEWGTRKVEINVVRWGSFQRSASLLSQRTGYRHCREMLANIKRQEPTLSYNN